MTTTPGHRQRILSAFVRALTGIAVDPSLFPSEASTIRDTTMTTPTTPSSLPINERDYARPEVLVSAEWVAAHVHDPSLRLLESNEDILLYDSGHIRGAQKLDWHEDLNHAVVRDYIDHTAFERLVRRLGIDGSTTVVFYGDKNNWWATYAFWVFRLFDFPESQLRILDGGRAAWDAEGREFTTVAEPRTPTTWASATRDDRTIRAFRDEVRAFAAAGGQLVDVRSPNEFNGVVTHMPDYPQEGVLRGGHIPGARSVPWARAAASDGTFRSADALRSIYEGEIGLDGKAPVITYCRIGERSSHSWFVLTYLLGYPNVRNYDGSRTEWGNSVGLPIER